MFDNSKRATLAFSFSAKPNRRIFLAQTANMAGRSPFLALLPTLVLSKSAKAIQIAADDPRIRIERLMIGAEWGKLECYLARPKAEMASLPGLIVAHDRLGLTPHFEDVARRFAVEGFIALAPDYASRFGGTPSEPGPAMEIVGMTTWPDMTSRYSDSLAMAEGEKRQSARWCGWFRTRWDSDKLCGCATARSHGGRRLLWTPDTPCGCWRPQGAAPAQSCRSGSVCRSGHPGVCGSRQEDGCEMRDIYLQGYRAWI
jgi:Dienelactone hydrolase family